MMTVQDRAALTRRQTLAGLSIFGAGSVLGVSSTPILAKAPLLSTQAAAFYRFNIGNMEATVISDGPLNFPDAGKIFRGATESEIRKMLIDEFFPPDTVRMEQNILVVNTGEKLVMFDTGILSMKQENAPSGRILKSLAESGIEAKDIDAIVLTHPHIDHAGGIMSADGKTRLFPNAQIYTTEADFNFWTNEQLLGTRSEGSARTAMKNLLPNKDRLVMYKDGQEIAPGIQAIASPGHTVGHTSFMITSAGKSLCFTGDIAHHAIMLRNPRLEVVFDTDSKQATASRIKMCDMLATERIPALIFHMPWPGIGNIAKQDNGFRFVPVPIFPVPG